MPKPESLPSPKGAFPERYCVSITDEELDAIFEELDAIFEEIDKELIGNGGAAD